jgi:phosphate acetyltransferase
MSTETLRQDDKHDALIARCRGLAPVSTAVVHPCDEPSLAGAIDAAEAGIISPVLVGPISAPYRAAISAGSGST